VLSKRVSQNLWVLHNFGLRLRLDLQFRSIVAALQEELKAWPAQGRLLDFGSGAEPYRRFIPPNWQYTSVDVAASGALYRSLDQLPAGELFDRIWVIEVLEHIEDPQALLKDLRRKLSAGGSIWISVPFAARIHPCPHDFLRWTPEALTRLLEISGFEITEFKYRGSDFATLMSKLIYFFARRLGFNFCTLCGIFLSPILWIGILICQWPGHSLPEVAEDPLGLVIKAQSSVHTQKGSASTTTG
jgi:hypothetical protein